MLTCFVHIAAAAVAAAAAVEERDSLENANGLGNQYGIENTASLSPNWATHYVSHHQTTTMPMPPRGLRKRWCLSEEI